MKESFEKNKWHSERGGAGAKLLIFGVLAFLIAHGLYNYGMTSYQAANFKQDLQTAVVQGVTLPTTAGDPKVIIQKKIATIIPLHQLPSDTFYEVKKNGTTYSARVYYQVVVPILPFGLYDYNYVFDHTATPGDFYSD